jgi:predicted ArsR family transcriptional regulator
MSELRNLGAVPDRAVAPGSATVGEHSPGPPNGHPTPGPNGHAAHNGHANGAATPPPTLRREILIHLRQAGPTSPDGLAAALGASRTGVLQQLYALEDAGLVTHAAEKHGVGRPRHVYDVTADAQGMFPADYGGFASGLVKAMEAVGGEDLVEQVFAARRRQVGDRIRRRMAEALPADASVADKARFLAVLQDEAGYLAEVLVAEDGALRLREHNCAIDKIARRTTVVCDAELALFRELLDVPVERELHIASGDRCCSYRVGSPAD